VHADCHHLFLLFLGTASSNETTTMSTHGHRLR
jgi:hypothetical protein